MHAWLWMLFASVVIAGCLAEEVQPGVHRTSYGALLGPTPFDGVVVEIDFVEGREPAPEALEWLFDTLRNVTGKQRLRSAGPTEVPAFDDRPDTSRIWTTQQMETFHATHFDSGPAEATGVGRDALIHVMYLDGRGHERPGESDRVLGVAVSNRIYLFHDALVGITTIGPSIDDARHPAASDIERHVLVHELGHVLGLVNHGVPMVQPREHPEAKAHSRHDTSVMFPTLDSYEALADLIRNEKQVPYNFDRYDLEDLATFRAAAPS